MTSYVFNTYGVEKTGKVINLNTGREVKSYNHHGKLRVDLYLDKIRNRYYIHELVALYWLDNPDELPNVYTIDGNYLNCNLDNLYWGK